MSKDLVRDARVNIVIIDRRSLRLGSGVRYPESYEQAVKALRLDIREYIRDLLVS
ncbi:MAG: hypothetical protein ABWJ42_04335 [Sulfolobales archaeon]